ncbi:MAG: hypothetical protein EP329_28355 [Deltaproteobacteria bacterium]|nr:MAG: hypothetical protein EP329_28355 [Deltaproteobacteria bacterium]
MRSIPLVAIVACAGALSGCGDASGPGEDTAQVDADTRGPNDTAEDTLVADTAALDGHDADTDVGPADDLPTPTLSRITSHRHGCAVRGGKVTCWGAPGSDRLGDGVIERRSQPRSSPALEQLGPLVGLALSDHNIYLYHGLDQHGCALTATGEVWCWGRNERGQVGDGTATWVAAPVRPPGLPTIAQISVGNAHSCARTSAGAVFCWGDNTFGQVGPVDRDWKPTPAQVAELSEVTEIAAGRDWTCALRGDGSVWCMGSVASGSATPTALATLPPAAHISGQVDQLCALTTDGGEVWCLQDGVPVQIAGLSDVEVLEVGGYWGCAIDAAHTLSCWSNWGAPVTVQIDSPLTRLAVGSTGCGLDDEGRVFCWDQEGADVAEPTAVDGLPDAARLYGGDTYVCASTRAGETRCWGFWPPLMPPAPDPRTQPLDIPGTAVAVVSEGFDCALLDTGKVWCWGDAYGSTPVEVRGPRALGLVASGGMACAVVGDVDLDERVACWGAGDVDGLTRLLDPILLPEPACGTPDCQSVRASVRDLVGRGHGWATGFCAVVRPAGRPDAPTHVMCWGEEPFAPTPTLVPVPIEFVGRIWMWGVAICAQAPTGGAVSCVSTEDFGNPQGGQAGQLDLPEGVGVLRQLGDGCLLSEAGVVWCREGGWAEVGASDDGEPAAPKQGLVAEDLAVDAVTCALGEDETVWCWGPSNGPLSFMREPVGATPRRIEGLTDIEHVDLTDRIGCAVDAANEIWCWGRGADRLAPDESTPQPYAQLDHHVFDLGGADVEQLATSVDFAYMEYSLNEVCLRLSDGTVRCFGRILHLDERGGCSGGCALPAAISGLAGVTDIAGSGSWAYGNDGYVCALHGGAVSCWGKDNYSVTGGPTRDAACSIWSSDAWVDTPAAVAGVSAAVAIDADGGAACAVIDTGEVYCWGHPDIVGVGQGGSCQPGGDPDCCDMITSTPTPIPGLTTAKEVALGEGFGCARLGDGTVSCWGVGRDFQLGDGHTVYRSTPVTVPGLSGVVQLGHAGATHICALTGAGEVWCWGAGPWATDPAEPRALTAPERVFSGAKEVASGGDKTCFVTTEGEVWCIAAPLDSARDPESPVVTLPAP